MSEVRLIDANALKYIPCNSQWCYFRGDKCNTCESRVIAKHSIDNAPTVEQECYITGEQWNQFMKEHRRSHGECKTCRYRDPEDKKCDCGGLERQGCSFPVSDDYFCKFYERAVQM